MHRSHFSEPQRAQTLKHVKAGRSAKEFRREHGISDATDYNWKPKHEGMEVSDIKRLKEPEATTMLKNIKNNNRRLKQMFADLSLENRALKGATQESYKHNRKEVTGELSARCSKPSTR